MLFSFSFSLAPAQLGSWAWPSAIATPDGDFLVLDELEEFDWEPEHKSGRREQVIQVLAG